MVMRTGKSNLNYGTIKVLFSNVMETRGDVVASILYFNWAIRCRNTYIVPDDEVGRG